MALIRKVDYKGLRLKSQYVKANACWVDLSLFADIDARTNGIVLDGMTVRIPISSAVYTLLKAEMNTAVDELDNIWKLEEKVEVVNDIYPVKTVSEEILDTTEEKTLQTEEILV